MVSVFVYVNLIRIIGTSAVMTFVQQNYTLMMLVWSCVLLATLEKAANANTITDSAKLINSIALSPIHASTADCLVLHVLVLPLHAHHVLQALFFKAQTVLCLIMLSALRNVHHVNLEVTYAHHVPVAISTRVVTASKSYIIGIL